MEDFKKTFELVLNRVTKEYSTTYDEDTIFNAVNKAVNTIHEEEVQAIIIKSRNGESNYCEQCGNCCQEYGIILRPEDIYALSKTVNIVDNITNERGVYKFKEQPCRYLHSDGRCECYTSRPLTCRNHPLTNPEEPRIIRDPNCEYILRLLSDISISMLTGKPFGGK